jgi:hypothetical protein
LSRSVAGAPLLADDISAVAGLVSVVAELDAGAAVVRDRVPRDRRVLEEIVRVSPASSEPADEDHGLANRKRHVREPVPEIVRLESFDVVDP